MKVYQLESCLIRFTLNYKPVNLTRMSQINLINEMLSLFPVIFQFVRSAEKKFSVALVFKCITVYLIKYKFTGFEIQSVKLCFFYVKVF